MKKVLIVINVDNAIDLITNSSSELFVLSAETKDIVVELLEATAPGYLERYEPVMRTDELSNDALDNYLHYELMPWSNSQQRQLAKVLPGFTYDEMYEEKRYSWQREGSEPSIRLKNNGSPDRDYGDFVTDENRQRVIDALDPEKNKYFLFSLDENPDWDEQEKLMEIGRRYHLG